MQSKENHFSKLVEEARQIFFGLHQSPPPKEIQMVSVGCERCLPEYLVDRKSFPQPTNELQQSSYTTFDFVVEGKGNLLLNGQKHRLIPGCLYVYAQNVPHKISTDPNFPMLKYFLVCAHDHSFRPFGSILDQDFGLIGINSIDEITGLFELIVGNANLDSSFARPICNALTNALVLKICEDAELGDWGNSRAWTTYNRILQHLRTNYYRIKSIEQLADETNLDPAYLSRIFKRFHKEGPYKFLIRLKMSHAASLLLNSGYLVKQVAYELGYENPFHFSRSFKSIYGLSPENFVKERKNA